MKCGSKVMGLFTGLVPDSPRRNKIHIGKFYPTKRDGLVRVIELIDGESVKVQFINTGFEREVLKVNLKAGKCADKTVKDRTWPKTYPNLKLQSNNCGEFTILEKKGVNCRVVFTETGYITTANINNLKAGKINDPYSKSRYGVGYLGEDFTSDYKQFAYTLWSNMLKRCYSIKDTRGYFGKGKDVFVNTDWLCFRTFAHDLKKLHNFDKWLVGQRGVSSIKYNLDKDFAYIGCSEYSLNTCQFIEESLNKSTTSKNPKSSENIAKFNYMKEYND